MDESRLTLQTQALALRCLQALEELGSPDDPVWGSGESTLPLDVILGLTYETSRYRDWIQQSGAEGKGFINILSHEDMLHELLRFSLVKIAATILMLEGGLNYLIHLNSSRTLLLKSKIYAKVLTGR